MTDVFGKMRGFWGTKNKQSDKRGRIFTDVNKDEYFVKQLEEFRERAMELQQLLDTKENRVQELTRVVNEREQKAQKLQEVLEKRRQEAERITRDVEECVVQISRNMEKQLEQISMGNDAKMAQISVQFDSGVENLKGELTRQLEQLESLKQALSDKLGENLAGQLEAMKAELAEKVHTENVKSYRNMQSLIEELGEKLDTGEQQERRTKSLKRYLRAAIVLGVLNLLAMAGLFLYELGILDYWMW